jgi:hypothetical protein
VASSNLEGPGEDLTYIKYSAKEILFHLTQKVESLQAEINAIRQNMVTREELTTARRWAFGAAVASGGCLIALLRYLEV